MHSIEDKILDAILENRTLTDEEKAYLDDHPDVQTWIDNVRLSLSEPVNFIADEDYPVHDWLLQAEIEKKKKTHLYSLVKFIAAAMSLIAFMIYIAFAFGFQWMITLQVVITTGVPWVLVFIALRERRRSHV